MPTYSNVNGVWRESAGEKINVGGTWRDGTYFVNVGGTWRPIKRSPPTNWVYKTAYVGTNSTSLTTYYFTPTKSDWYKIYCIGASANGALSASGGNGTGGGGSGGIAIGQQWLFSGLAYTIKLSRTAVFIGSDATLTANPGIVTDYSMNGGSGGTASGGNIINLSGYAGGDGGFSRQSGGAGYSDSGKVGNNGGMAGGDGGYTSSTAYATLRVGGGGGGGGARLPGDGYCPYIAAAYTTTYKAARGADWNAASTIHSQSYPSIVAGPNMKLYGGGGGGGGEGYNYSNGSTPAGGNPSNGSPEAVIIEQASY